MQNKNGGKKVQQAFTTTLLSKVESLSNLTGLMINVNIKSEDYRSKYQGYAKSKSSQEYYLRGLYSCG